MEPYTRADDLRVGLLARTEAHEPLRQVTHADILIGIPSYNNARTIGHVVRAVQASLSKYFPAEAAVEKLCVEFEGNKDYLIQNWK